ncbi:hypothetical protein J2X66_005850 [Pseudomonas sp. 3296]|uniref:hypothetical protein n=1 Tax=Pseudomonas sp. 3296 TaxID=2817753 RepID=UPI00285EC430|nr:hypothetical protein [Pseudomonas sp. 3296]MDR6918945.1 hypothetical protein [Pseudomonas sp. 3296]
MSNSAQKNFKRRIEIQREELTAYTAEFLERGGVIVEFPALDVRSAAVTPTKQAGRKKPK